MGSSPHEVEVHIVDADFMEAMCVEQLTDNLGIRLNHLEGEVIAGASGVA